MAETSISNFRMRATVKKHLIVCSIAAGKNMTATMDDMIEYFYQQLLRVNPARVKSIEVALEQKPNVAIQ